MGDTNKIKGIILDDRDVRKLFVDGMPFLQDWIESPRYYDGEILYVKEAWRPAGWPPTGWPYEYRATAVEDMTPTDGRFKYAKTMPIEAARYFVQVKYGETKFGATHVIFEPVDDPRQSIYYGSQSKTTRI